ncbi:hypothetical protein [Adhaeribacter soli]|uniref:Uncharacterized protein n=1 Tax=Adhaeribacter soli TaxID=2607655 RepID=A0A5N1J4R3_9BACT|nr:hypothetical protein [Adhaeribacter soli]KAA9340069.1 hypothetical protein F0P94_06890 [Adhaeribacter soli]
MRKGMLLRFHAARLRAFSKTFVAFLMVAGLVSCEQRGCDNPVPQAACNTFVTVEIDPCWNSFLGNTLLRTDNGELLLPQNSLMDLPELQQGQRVKIAYLVEKADPVYANSCTYVQAPEETIPVTITCFEEPVFFCGTGTDAETFSGH